MATEYFTAESVRNQLLKAGLEIEKKFIPSDFPDDWNYCPCMKKKNGTCSGECNIPFGIFIKNPLLGRIPIEIFYKRSEQIGLIRTNNMKINMLIENEIIDRSELILTTI